MDRARLPRLWHFPISHFNEKVRWALDHKGIPHVREVLTLDYLPRAWWATGQGSLPILHLDGRAIADSTAIIAALEERFPDRPLYPADEQDRRRALELEDYFDEQLGPAVRAVGIGTMMQHDRSVALAALTTGWSAGKRRVAEVMGPLLMPVYMWRHRIDLGQLEREMQTVAEAMDRIVAERQPSGYLVGEEFSVADLTAASLMSAAVMPAEMQYRLPGGPPAGLTNMQATTPDHPSFEWVRDIYRRHRGMSAEVTD